MSDNSKDDNEKPFPKDSQIAAQEKKQEESENENNQKKEEEEKIDEPDSFEDKFPESKKEDDNFPVPSNDDFEKYIKGDKQSIKPEENKNTNNNEQNNSNGNEEEEEEEENEEKEEDKREEEENLEEQNEEEKEAEEEITNNDNYNNKKYERKIKIKKTKEETKDDKYSEDNDNNKFDEKIEADYYGQKGIIKRTLGIGKVNVRVYPDDDEEKDTYDSDKNISTKKGNKEKQKTCNETPIENNKNQIIKKTENRSKEKKITEKKTPKKKDKNKDVLIYNIDGKKFEIHVKWFYIMSKDKEQNINITISTIYPGSQIMHWGIYKSSSPKDWSMPPKSCFPKLSKSIKDRALETKFCSSNNNNERTISITLPKKISYNEYIEGIYFAIYDPVKNIWYNNYRNNFNIQFTNNNRNKS